MSNTLYIPLLNPLDFVPVTPPSDTTLFATRHIDDYHFDEQVYKWQDTWQFLQPWVGADIIPLQFESNFTPIQLDLYSHQGRLITGKSAAATQKRANRYLPGYFVYEAALSLNGLPGPGPYRYILTPGGDTTQQQKSNWFMIRPNPLDTVRIDYRNSHFHEDVLFETGIRFSIRVPGYIEYMAPGSKVVVFEDQPLNQALVSGRTFRQILFHCGDGSGVTPTIIDQVNRAACCDDFRIDNKQFAIDGKWTEASDPDTAFKGFSIAIREGLNRTSRIINASIDPTKKIALISNIDGQLFSDVSANAGETVIRILSQG